MNKIKGLILSLLMVVCAGVLFGCSQVVVESKTAYDIAVENGFDGTVQEWLDSLKIEGDSAYEIAVKNGFEGTEEEWLDSLKSKSAYELAVENGFVGTEEEWLASLTVEGDSAYEIAVKNGFEGTEEEWLDSLKSKSAYELAVENGFVGTEEEWLASLTVEGDSAYEIAVKNGFEGSEQEWLDSLKEAESAYDIAVKNGFEGTEKEWLESLRGADGENGAPGEDGVLTAESMFELAVKFGLYENTSEGYAQFLEDYILSTSDTSIEMVANRCINSVVDIFLPTETPGNFYVGSGVITEFNTEQNYAYIVTNYHVVTLESLVNGEVKYNVANTIYCYSYGYENLTATSEQNSYGDGFIAKYIGGSAEYDIAVLKVEGAEFEKIKDRDLIPVTFGDSSKLSVGEDVIAIGNPKGDWLSVSRGVVSKVYEVSNTTIAGEIRAISGFRVDASINKGNSGGGIFNLDGEFIGISNAKYIGIGYEGLGNAIYSNTVKAIYQNILDGYNKGDGSSVGVKRLSLGISYNKVDNVGSDYDESTGLTTATIIPEVVSVNDGSVADVVGLQVGDLLVGVKVERGESSFTYDITMPYNLTEICINVRAGDKIFVIVERNNERVELAEYTVLETDFVESKDNA